VHRSKQVKRRLATGAISPNLSRQRFPAQAVIAYIRRKRWFVLPAQRERPDLGCNRGAFLRMKSELVVATADAALYRVHSTIEAVLQRVLDGINALTHRFCVLNVAPALVDALLDAISGIA